MKYAFWGFGLIMAGLFGLVFIVMFESITVNNENEYYTLKEAMEASMLESVDFGCFRNSNIDDKGVKACNGSVKIVEQKFVENFTRRFAASVGGDVSGYQLEFLDIIESPPKATVIVTGDTQKYFVFEENDADSQQSFSIVNNLTGIIEAKDWEYITSLDGDNTVNALDVENESDNSVSVNALNQRKLNIGSNMHYVDIIINIEIDGIDKFNMNGLFDIIKSGRDSLNCNKNNNQTRILQLRCNGEGGRNLNLYDEKIISFFDKHCENNSCEFLGWALDREKCKKDNTLAKTGESTVSINIDNSSPKTFYACFFNYR